MIGIPGTILQKRKQVIIITLLIAVLCLILIPIEQHDELLHDRPHGGRSNGNDREIMLMYGENISNLESYREYLMHFYTMTFAGMVENWILEEMNMTPDMIVAYMERLIADQLNGARMRFDLIKNEKTGINKPKSLFDAS